MSALKPDAVASHDLGTSSLPWQNLHVDQITMGARAGGTTLTIGSEALLTGGTSTDLVVHGNLTVNGNTTTINSTTLTVDDKNIVVAQGAAASVDWSGSGLIVGGVNATLLYTDDGAGTTQWEFSDNLELTGKLLPVANATHDLGSSSFGWNDLYLGDGGIIQLGDDQDVTLTHVADSGIRLNDAMKFEFRDSTEFLHSDADGSMTLEGGSTVKLSVNSNTVLSVNANSIDLAKPLNVDDATESTSVTTGSLIVDGGMGLAGDAHFGGDLSLQHDAAVLHLGADDDVSLTHIPDTGLLLNNSRQLQFGDSATYIHQSADSQLDLVADGELALTAPVVDIDASNAVRISNDLELDSDEAALKFGADSDVSLTHVVDTGLLLNDSMQLQFRDAGLKIYSTLDSQLDIDSDGEIEISASTNLDIDAADVQIDASSTFSIQGAGDSDITVSAATKGLSLLVAGGGEQVLSLTSAGTGTDAIDINASAGGVDIDASGVLALDGAGGIDIGKTADVKIDIESADFDLDASGAITIDGTSTISIGGAAAAGDITIGTNATARNITIGNVTGVTALKLDSGTGGILIGSTADSPVDIDATTFDLDASSTLSLDGGDTTNLTMTANSADTKTLTISASNSGAGEGRIGISSDDQVSVTDGTATLLLDGGAATIDTSGVVELNSSGSAISIGNDNVNQNINLGTAGARTLTVGSDSATKVDLNAVTIEADATTKILLDSAGTGTDAIDIKSAGGLDVDVADAISLTTTSDDGHIELVSAHAAGVALHIDANANAGSILDIDAGILDLDTDGAANIDAGAALSLQGGAASDFTTSAGALTLDGAGGINIVGNAAEVDITTTGALDINAGATTLDASTLSIDSTDTTNLTMTANNAAERVLTIDAANSGAGAAKIVIGATEATAVQIGHSTSEVTIGDNLTVLGNLTVSGTQTIVDTVTMQAANAIVFEGASADDFESTLTIIDPTADRTIKLPNQSGCLPVLAVDSDVQITATPDELNYVDVTPGTATASKALVLDGSKNIDEIGTIGSGAITSTGASSFGSMTTSGRIEVNDASDATNTTDGSLQTDGGLSVVKDAVLGNDLKLLSDSAVISLGVHSDATLTHDGTTGLTIAASPISIDSTGELHLSSTLGDIKFQDGAGADQLAFDLDGTAGEVIMKLMVDADDFVFKQFDGTEVFRVEDNGDFDIAGGAGSSGVTVSAAGQITADGRILVDNTAEATNTADGSLQTDGGLSVVKSVVVGDDLSLLSDGSILNFGANEDVSLTHVHDTGLLLNAGMALRFRDATLEVKSSVDGQLDILADAVAKVTSPTVELEAATEVLLDSPRVHLEDDSAALVFGADDDVTFTHDGATGLNVNSAGAFNITAGALTLDGAGGINIAGNAAEVDITTSGALDINGGSTTIDVAALSIDSTDTTNLTMTANSADEKVLTIDAVNNGAGAAKISLGTTSGTTISIGHTTSETSINDNLTVVGLTSLDGGININDKIIITADNGDYLSTDGDFTLTNGNIILTNGDLEVGGDLTVSSALSSNGTELTIKDSHVLFASSGANNISPGQTFDMGFYAKRDSGSSSSHVGLIYDNEISGSKWRLHEGLSAPNGITGKFDFSGSTPSALELGQVYLNDAAEDGGNGVATPLTTHATYYATGGAETSTLAAGSEGQVKVLAMKTDNGDMVVTVTNAAWGGSGTVTLSAQGQACTLQYIDSQWYCIGNNGATFG